MNILNTFEQFSLTNCLYKIISDLLQVTHCQLDFVIHIFEPFDSKVKYNRKLSKHFVNQEEYILIQAVTISQC